MRKNRSRDDVIKLNSILAACFIFLSVMPGQTAATQDGKDEKTDQESVVHLGANLVELFITVKDGDRFVNGLTRDDFQVYDNGVLQSPAFFDTQDVPISVALLLDNSGSMQSAIGTLQAGAVKFVESLNARDEVTVFSFGGFVKQLVPFTRDKARLTDVIKNTFADGQTPLYDAIARALSKLGAARGRRAIVLFTDGADTSSKLSPENIIRLSGRMAVPLFIIGSGDALKDSHLRRALDELAERTGGKAFFLKRTEDMAKAFADISEYLKSSYRTGYYLSRPPDGKWHAIFVRLTSKKGRVITRQGYYAK